MTDALYLAYRYLSFHRWRTVALVASIGLILAVPLAMERVLAASERSILARAEATPLVVGAKGSALDLMMNTLYFTDERPEPITIAAADTIWDSGLADAIPLYVKFTAEGAPVVGTTVDYFAFRGLEIADGRGLAVLGEAVLGAALAERLDLGPGDAIVSDAANLFDVAGVYPLKMRVVGVLAPTGGPDDGAVLVDLKTAWVIEGIGHGHEDVVEADDDSLIAARSAGQVEASARLRQYAEITEANIDSFHFHGDPSLYPATAVIADPYDERSRTILQGRYLDADVNEQVAKPAEVMSGLVDTIFGVKRLIDAIVAVFALAAAVALALAIYLSLQLRAREIETIAMIGCRRGMISRLVAAEICIVVAAAAGLAGLVLVAVTPFSTDISLYLLQKL